jgi:hypothetical protein
MMRLAFARLINPRIRITARPPQIPHMPEQMSLRILHPQFPSCTPITSNAIAASLPVHLLHGRPPNQDTNPRPFRPSSRNARAGHNPRPSVA